MHGDEQCADALGLNHDCPCIADRMICPVRLAAGTKVVRQSILNSTLFRMHALVLGVVVLHYLSSHMH